MIPYCKTNLKTLYQDPNVQLELKSPTDSLGEPVLVGLTKEEQDLPHQLLEPTTSRGKHPLLIPDFISFLPIVLQEDRETLFRTSDDTKIIIKSSQEKNCHLTKFHFLSGQRLTFILFIFS